MSGPTNDYSQMRRKLDTAVAIRLAVNCTGMGLLLAYLGLVFGTDLLARYWYPIMVSIVTGFALGLVLTLWRVRRIVSYFRARHRDIPAAGFDSKLVRDALNAPVAIALVDLVAWSVAGSALSLFLMHEMPGQAQRMFVHGFISNLYTGLLVAIGDFYLLEAWLSRTLWPWFLQGRRVSDIRGVVPVPFYARVSALILSASVSPMLFMYLIESVGDGGGLILLAVIASTLFCATAQGIFLLGSIARPLGQLSGAFGRLQDGHTEADERTGIYRADAIGRLAEMFEDLVATMHERDFIRSTFSRYLSQQVVDQILNGQIELGGQHYDATVLFADIRGFTSRSERMEPEQVVTFLNEYLEHMVQAITSHDGIPDKFIGDGILAVWGVPVQQTDHVVQATAAAFEMIAQLEAFNRVHADAPVTIGIGLHCGDLIAGNIGSKHKMEFTVIGDTVNTCSRVEALNKTAGTTLTVTHAVYERLPDSMQQRFQPGRTVQLRGKADDVIVYSV